jgi:hypothetical protein
MIPNISLLQGSFIGVALGMFLGASATYKVLDWKYEAEKVASVQRTINQMTQIEQINDEVATRYEDQSEQIRVKYKTLYKTIYAYPDIVECVIPDDWVWAWNQANSAIFVSSPSFDEEVSRTGSSNRTNSEEFSTKPH